MVATAMQGLIDDQPDMTVIGIASTVAESAVCASQLNPDIVLLDFLLPDGTGVDAGSQIRQTQPHAKLIFVSRDYDSNTRLAAFNVGAKAYIHKSNAASELVDAIRLVSRGDSLMPPTD